MKLSGLSHKYKFLISSKRIKWKSILRPLRDLIELPISLIIVAIVLALAFFINSINKSFNSAPVKKFRNLNEIEIKRRLLVLVPDATLEALEKKGVMWMLYERDLNGYFEHVHLSYFPSNNSQRLILNDRIVVSEQTPLLRGAVSISYLTFLFKMLKLIRAEEIYLIHAQHPYFLGVVGILLNKLTRIPCVISIHADYDVRYVANKLIYTFLFRKLDKLCEKFVFSQATLIFPIRPSLAQYVIRSGADPAKIRVIPHGIQPDNFLQTPDSAFKRKYGFDSNSKIVTFVGRIAKDNYLEDIVHVASKVIETIPQIIFLLIGDGPERERLLPLVAELGIETNIKFLGWQSHEKVAYFRVNTDINLVPMGGFSLIEAAMSGKAVVAYDVEWHAELIKNGENGCLVPNRDTQAMANAIVQLLKNPKLAKQYGAAARQAALAQHTTEATNIIKARYYEEALQSNK